PRLDAVDQHPYLIVEVRLRVGGKLGHGQMLRVRASPGWNRPVAHGALVTLRHGSFLLPPTVEVLYPSSMRWRPADRRSPGSVRSSGALSWLRGLDMQNATRSRPRTGSSGL